MFKINKVSSESIPLIQKLSDEIWRKVYPSIISIEQINFMLDMMYSTASLEKQISQDAHQFIVLTWDNEPVGFASYSKKSPADEKTYRLNKLYLQPELHKKGLGKAMIHFISEEVCSLGGKYLELNVNRQNPSVDFYKKNGFKITSENILDIGNGYFMDDYIMTLEL